MFLLSACVPFANGSVRFQDAQHGQPFPGTDFQLSLETETQQIGEGRSLRTDTLSLVHTQTGNPFLISARGRFLAKTSAGLTCQDCITVLEVNGRTYFLTRFHGGGSGGFYFHDVAELTDGGIVAHGTYSSCGQVFFNGDQLTFPSREFKCPELFLSLESGPENVETLVLSE